MIETALEAGIEIPVFCYEPRLGAPVGACRMCLCEVEGMPKLQAACTMTAQDGLVLSTAQTSAKAAEGQNAALEFILLNHPLDCPDCDKGGECPLQDLTFRWGPGATRMRFAIADLRQADPGLPTDRARPRARILCYRCTRFSETVAEDGQLVAINRGAGSVIATFEEALSRALLGQRPRALPGRGADLDDVPVPRATVGDPERPHGLRPCPAGATPGRRRARARRRASSRGTTPKWTKAGSATRAASPTRTFAPTTGSRSRGAGCAGEASSRSPGKRTRRGRARLKEAGGPVVVAFSGGETVETPPQSPGSCRRASAEAARCPGHPSRPRPLPRADLGDPRRGRLPGLRDEPVVERAPVLDLWLRARRAGAEVITLNSAGSAAPSPEAPPGRPPNAGRKPRQGARDASGVSMRPSASRSSGRRTTRRAEPTRARSAESLGDKSSVYLVPRTPNGRGSRRCGDPGSVPPEGELGALIVSTRPLGNPDVRDFAERAKFVITTAMFVGGPPGRTWSSRAPATSSATGRLSTSRAGRSGSAARSRLPPRTSSPLRRTRRRFGVEVDRWPTMLPDDHAALPEVEEADARCAAEGRRPETWAGPRARPLPVALQRGGGRTRAAAQFQRPADEVELSYEDATARGIAAALP